MKQTEKVRSFKSKRLIILIGIALLVVFSTVAWFVFTLSPVSDTFLLSNFNVQPDCYFMNGTTRVEKTSYVDSQTGLINLSTDSSAENYIGKFRVDVKYKGAGHAYLRVKVVTQIKDSSGNVTLSDSKIPYTLYAVYSDSNSNNQQSWYDNRNADYYYYYASILSGNTNDTTLSLITGCESFDEDSGFDVQYLNEYGYSVAVAIECEMVQINRYPQIWGVATLPWKA